jgi:hypothetical protein
MNNAVGRGSFPAAGTLENKMRERLMRRRAVAFGQLALALLMVAFFFSPVFPQDDVMELQPEGVKNFERPLVKFSHGKHAQVINCSRCHHDYDKYGNNAIKGEEDVEGRHCAECHEVKPVKGQNRLGLIDAFHMQCRGCHERMRAEDKTAGPVACGECHVRK